MLYSYTSIEFIEYSSDMTIIFFTYHITYMYADDFVLYLSGNNWDNMRRKIQENLFSFLAWGELNWPER